MPGMEMGMQQFGGYFDNMEQRMMISPRLRSKALSKRKKKRLFRFTGKTVQQQKEWSNGGADRS